MIERLTNEEIEKMKKIAWTGGMLLIEGISTKNWGYEVANTLLNRGGTLKVENPQDLEDAKICVDIHLDYLGFGKLDITEAPMFTAKKDILFFNPKDGKFYSLSRWLSVWDALEERILVENKDYIFQIAGIE